MPFRDILSQAKSRIGNLTHPNQPQQILAGVPPLPHAPPIPSNKPHSVPPIPANKPTISLTYWLPPFSSTIPVSQHFKHQLGAHGWGNNELQNYTADPANSFHDAAGNLVVRAISGNGIFTSARLTSHQTLSKPRGSVVFSATSPCAPGIWPALWLLPREPFVWPHEGEVDILESSNMERINHTCLHWGFFAGEDHDKHRVVETPIPDIGANAHTYEFAWEQFESGEGGRMVWYIDGRLIMKASIPAGTRSITDFQVIINVAMGGNLCQGQRPADGQYDLVVHSMKMSDSPSSGWARFQKDWKKGPGGHTM